MRKFTQESILIEQIKLLMGNVGSSVIPGLLLALLMLNTLSNVTNSNELRVWCAAVILSKLNFYLLARRKLTSGIPHQQARGLFWQLIVLNALDGCFWGALAWVTLDSASKVGSILVISVLAGVAGSAMSLMAPVLPVFIAFIITEIAVIVFKLWVLGDPTYHALGLAGLLYLAALLGQGINSARAARAAIELRFENSDLVDQLRVESEIADKARQEAEEANAAKSKFLAAASHDLRQPIHAQGLFLEVLSRTRLSPQQQELVTSTRAASEATAGMLDTLLDFSRIEADAVEPYVQAFKLQPLLNKIEREFAPQADAKGLSFRSRETNLVIHSDPALIELILRNLVSNAIRYTEAGGLLVACRRRGDVALLEVWDTGIGIPASQQREVFREFHQLGNPERDRRKGLGLGLAIADGLARRLDHTLTLRSAPNHGSVFRLSLPISSATPVEQLIRTAVQSELHDLRVLVIDDDEIVRAGMRYLLREWGCICETAESIEEALEQVRQQVPDIVISDYRLREQRTGSEAIAALRSLLKTELPALLITGDTAPDRIREAQASGIPLLHKPVPPDSLFQALVEISQKAREFKEIPA